MDRAPPPRTWRLPNAPRLAEGFAKKVLLPVGEGEPPVEVVLCRVAGRVRAFDSLCPHEGGRLAEGPLMDGRDLLCPLHLYRFDATDGSAVQVDCPPAMAYEVVEVDGWVEIRVDLARRASVGE